MNELSIFIDESGDFGEYSYHSPYYIISMVFHEQSIDISKLLACYLCDVHQQNVQIFRFRQRHIKQADYPIWKGFLYDHAHPF